MSMFYELMMRKKTEIMYATIKGSLTENDGVFSEFSDSNYLALQNSFKLNANTVAEFKFKINLTNVSSISGIIGTPNSYGFQFVAFSDSKLTLYLGNGSSWNIVSAEKGTTLLQANTDYYIRLLINKGNITLLLSTDDTNWTIEFSVDVTISEEYTYNLAFGRGRTTSQYLRGSIDLPNSYIKLGSTKYNLQAVVGYTVAGSPTIADGVVSGFSSGNYLKLTNCSALETFNFEVKFKFNVANFTNIQDLCFGHNRGFGIRISTDGVMHIYISRGGGWEIAFDVTITTISTNTDYYLKFVYDGATYKVKISIDDINYTDYIIANNTNKMGFASPFELTIGTNNDGTQNYFSGSIYIKDSYIKINNKLWFNGQQA